jgi:paraquat-inducible protein B
MTLEVRPRVRILIYPERLIARADDPEEAALARSLTNGPQGRHALLRRLVEERGMRAQLKSSSLLTGQLYVALDYFPRAPKSRVDWTRNAPEIPVVPGAATDIESRLASVIDKIDKLPINEIGTNLNADLATLDLTLKDARKLLGDADTRLLPQLQSSLEGIDRMVAAGEHLMKDADATVAAPDAPAQQELRDALKELTQAARSLRNLTDYLEQHPDSIVRGKYK